MIDVNKILKAIANEKRLTILRWLKNPSKEFVSAQCSAQCNVQTSGVCVGLIEKKIGLSQSTVSQYLMQLQQANLITMERKGQWTYCKRNQETIQAFIQELKTRL